MQNLRSVSETFIKITKKQELTTKKGQKPFWKTLYSRVVGQVKRSSVRGLIKSQKNGHTEAIVSDCEGNIEGHMLGHRSYRVI